MNFVLDFIIIPLIAGIIVPPIVVPLVVWWCEREEQ